MLFRTYLVGYDISDHRQRRTALTLLRAHSAGYQDSAFEVQTTLAGFVELLTELKALLDNDNDRLFWVELQSYSHCWQLGTGPKAPIGDLLIIM